MSSRYPSWSEVKGKAREADPRTDGEPEAGQALAVERREAYVRGHLLAEMRQASGLTQADMGKALGVSQARISQIEHGEMSGIDVIRAYVSALGGTLEFVASLGNRTWRIA